MRFDFLTLFPELFNSFAEVSIIGKAVREGHAQVNTINIRDYSSDKHRSVDEPPFGGGAGMVLGPQAIFDAVESVKGPRTRVCLLSPQGRVFDQQTAERLSLETHLVFICGHYEGVDDRVRANLAADEICIGDFVLTGGELAAMVVADAVVRLLPGVLGNRESAFQDSFSTGLLEHPHFTRPREFRGLEVPEVLLSGNHGHIDAWRKKEALRRTLQRRVDLLNKYSFSRQEIVLLREIIQEQLESV